MPEVTALNTIYNWFKSQLKPSQDQFYNTFFSFRHKSDKIVMDDLHDDVKAIINDNGGDNSEAIDYLMPVVLTGTASWVVSAGTLVDKILVVEPTVINFSIGTSNEGEELIGATVIPTGSYVFSIDQYFAGNTTIYFNGITINTVIKIFKR